MMKILANEYGIRATELLKFIAESYNIYNLEKKIVKCLQPLDAFYLEFINEVSLADSIRISYIFNDGRVEEIATTFELYRFCYIIFENEEKIFKLMYRMVFSCIYFNSPNSVKMY